ncbi:hypothetical protein AKJ16_DCAP05038 [Drosera capensis]
MLFFRICQTKQSKDRILIPRCLPKTKNKIRADISPPLITRDWQRSVKTKNKICTRGHGESFANPNSNGVLLPRRSPEEHILQASPTTHSLAIAAAARGEV